MVVGIGKIVLSLSGNDSLKGKRAILRPILDRVRQRFNVAIAEVEDMDVHRRAVVGFSVVSNDARHANAMVDSVFAFIEEVGEAEVVGRTMEIVTVSGVPSRGEGDVTGRWSDYEDTDGT